MLCAQGLRSLDLLRGIIANLPMQRAGLAAPSVHVRPRHRPHRAPARGAERLPAKRHPSCASCCHNSSGMQPEWEGPVDP